MEKPKMAGAISFAMRREPGCEGSQCSFGSWPMVWRGLSWTINWTAPPITTPQANPITGVVRDGESQRAQTIIEMLKNTGVSAGTNGGQSNKKKKREHHARQSNGESIF
jgi:hypothetical protein